MYKVRIPPEAKSQLKKLKFFYQDAVGVLLQDLKEDPTLGKKLGRNLSGRLSYRIGVYRVVYKIIEKEKVVQILYIGHRSEVYN